MKNNIFDFNRFINLAKLNLMLSKKKILISLGGVVGIMAIIASAMAIFGNELPQIEDAIYTIAMVIAALGLVGVASKAFDNVNSSSKAISYLTIPSSTTEKFIWALLSSTILYAIVMMVTVYIGGTVSNLLYSIISHEPIMFVKLSIIETVLTVFEEFTFLSILIIHSIFFLGAIYFKKNPIGKVILTNMALNMYFTIVGLIVFGILMAFGLEGINDTSINIDDATMEFIVERFGSLLYIFPVILYTTAFFRFKEKEA